MSEEIRNDPAETPLKRRHTVVCVDDDLATLAAMKRQLRDEPYDVMTTTDPDVALEWIRDLDVGVLVTDQRMPVKTGGELLREVETMSPSTLSVVLTGYAEQVLAMPEMERSARLIFSKPWDAGEFRRAILELLRERESLDDSPPDW